MRVDTGVARRSGEVFVLSVSHSKNNNDLAFFTYDERRKLGYGTQKERLGKDSIKPFDACCICLKPLVDPRCCPKGHLFCNECILECVIAQKKDIKRKLALYELQQKRDQEEAQQRLNLEKERELEAFDRQNNSAVPHYDKRDDMDQKNGFQGANSVKVTSYEQEALKSMKAFWLPSATPEAAERMGAPSKDTVCPEGKEKLRVKDLFQVYFTELPSKDSSKVMDDVRYMCPSCSATLTNSSTIVALSSCGHVLCKKCVDKFIVPEKVCTVCSKACKPKNVVALEKGGTGFAGHDDHLEAKAFKHVGSGTGMGLYRPAPRV